MDYFLAFFIASSLTRLTRGPSCSILAYAKRFYMCASTPSCLTQREQRNRHAQPRICVAVFWGKNLYFPLKSKKKFYPNFYSNDAFLLFWGNLFPIIQTVVVFS